MLIEVRSKRPNATLKADGNALVFKDGVCEVEKTKAIQALLKADYIEEIKNVKTVNK